MRHLLRVKRRGSCALDVMYPNSRPAAQRLLLRRAPSCTRRLPTAISASVLQRAREPQARMHTALQHAHGSVYGHLCLVAAPQTAGGCCGAGAAAVPTGTPSRCSRCALRTAAAAAAAPSAATARQQHPPSPHPQHQRVSSRSCRARVQGRARASALLLSHVLPQGLEQRQEQGQGQQHEGGLGQGQAQERDEAGRRCWTCRRRPGRSWRKLRGCSCCRSRSSGPASSRKSDRGSVRRQRLHDRLWKTGLLVQGRQGLLPQSRLQLPLPRLLRQGSGLRPGWQGRAVRQRVSARTGTATRRMRPGTAARTRVACGSR